MTQSSGVGVVDKVVTILDAVAAGPASLAELVTRSGLARPTAYRIAVALESQGYLRRDTDGRFGVGPAVHRLAATGGDQLLLAAAPVLESLRDATGESAQLYRREGALRRCIAAAERASGLRDTVPVGSTLPMSAGSAAQVLLAWSGDVTSIGGGLPATTLARVRRQGWAATVAERETGVASVSAPVRDRHGVVAAVSVSGPIDRLTRSPGRLHGDAVRSAGLTLSAALGG